MIRTERYDCIMLAAGESTRMGSWKPLLPFRGSTVIEWSVRSALRSCRRIVLVVGYRGEELAERFRGRAGVETVENRDYRKGQLSSLVTGMERTEDSRFFVALGDMPLIGGHVYDRIAAEGRTAFAGGFAAVRPAFGGRPGHPVLLDRDRVFTDPPGDGIRSVRDILHALRVLEVPCSDAGVVSDIDTPADYAMLLRNEDG